MFQSKIFRLILVLLFCLFCIFFPIYNNYSLLQIVYGTIGSISVVTILLITIWIFNFVFLTKIIVPLNYEISLVITIFGLLLYMSSMGFIQLDIYSYGYYPNKIFILSIIMWCLFLININRLYSWITLIAIIGFYFKIISSNNLWDYIIDPIVWIMSIVTVIKNQIKEP